MVYFWLKAGHIVFVIFWMAGLFMLPRLFVYHSQAPADDRIGIERFKTMERKLYRGIMAPAAVLTIAFGLWLWLGYGITGAWLHAKVTFVAALVAFHIYLGFLLRDFARDLNAQLAGELQAAQQKLQAALRAAGSTAPSAAEPTLPVRPFKGANV